MPRNQKRQIEYVDILVIFNDFLFYVGEGGYGIFEMARRLTRTANRFNNLPLLWKACISYAKVSCYVFRPKK